MRGAAGLVDRYNRCLDIEDVMSACGGSFLSPLCGKEREEHALFIDQEKT